MMPSARLLAALAALFLITASGFARADVPPPNRCGAGLSAGDTCHDAYSDAGWNGAGVCVNTTCTHPTPPQPDAGPFTYSCMLCLLPDAGGGDTPTTDAGVPRTVDGGVEPSTADSGVVMPVVDAGGSPASDGGIISTPVGPTAACAVGTVRGRDIAPFGLMALGAALLAATRRRRDTH